MASFSSTSRIALAAAILGSSAGAMVFAHAELFPTEGTLARGVRVGGVAASPHEGARAAAVRAARRVLERRVSLTWAGAPLFEASVADLGGVVDVAAIASSAEEIGRRGGLFERLDDVMRARRGEIDLPVRFSIPIEPLAARLARVKDDLDTAPVAARLDVAHRTASAHAAGKFLDVYAALEAIGSALRAAAPTDAGVTAAVPAFEIAPRASSEVVASVDVSAVLSRFETRFGFVGDQAGRAQNIRRAAEQMEGVVLMPGEVVSFNANVGARSIENGFAMAPEIFKGELRDGIGGGTCQVSGTLHAAAYLGGVDIVERANHSRPSGYIRMGLDATVVFPTVDLKLRNPYDFPVVIHNVIDKGTLTFELLGARRIAKVEFETQTVGTAPFKRKIEESSALAEGKVRLKQKGIRGYSVKKTRVIHLEGGRDRVEVTTDTYPPTFEIYQVAPGTDIEQALPPLADDRTASNDAASQAPSTVGAR